MTPDTSDLLYTINGQPASGPPPCAGVYRFFSDSGSLLYIGKSIDMKSRLRSHFTDARKPGRQQRMIGQVAHIDCRPTAGEFGALLTENAAIKAETPLFNRRQRRARRLWTIALASGRDGFLQPTAQDFAPDGDRRQESFGLYHNRHHIESTLRKHARDRGLCLRVLGIDRGRGACFQYQLKRCNGACAGDESATSHNRRLLEVLSDERILAWPFAAAIALVERASEPLDGQPSTQWQLINHWSYGGSYTDQHQVALAARSPENNLFDRDAYRIMLNAMRADGVEIRDAHSGALLSSPFRDNRQAS